MHKIIKIIKPEHFGGILLISATILALIFSNTDLKTIYQSFLSFHIDIRINNLYIEKSLYHWINDGLMSIFFLFIGLEIKREIIDGNLSSIKHITLPLIGAIGGMLIPALIYAAFNYTDVNSMRGWAIPTATDIAFALGILSFLNNKIPSSLRIFLLALAIIDDLGAVIIIALFYTTSLSSTAIIMASICLLILMILNLCGVTKKYLYFIVGIILWISVLKSGIHATLAGVALAFTIPLQARDKNKQMFSPAKQIENKLQYFVPFFILPIFAFANAGVDITQISGANIFSNAPLGIFCGLFLGKQIGVLSFCYIAVKLKLASLPQNSNWIELYGIAVLTGVGFTMSLFIDNLAFPDSSLFYHTDKLAILIASFASAVLGYIILKSTINSLKK